MLEKIQQVAFEAIEKASPVALQYFRNHQLAIQDKRKNDAWDPVTVADKQTERVIREVIHHYFPDHNILGEEEGHLQQNSDYEWVIDPIDGTRAFVTGIPLWGILLGVTYQKKPLFGMMAQPYLGEIFYGDGKTAFLRHQGQDRRLQTATLTDMAQGLCASTSPDIYHTPQDKAWFAQVKNASCNVRYGTDCYGYMMLALGQVHYVFETGLSPYDIVPLLPIITGAGGVYSHPMGHDNIDDGAILVSANATLHQKMLEQMRLKDENN